jgi:hypothetical protein
MGGQPLSLWYKQTQKPGKYFLSYQVCVPSILLLVVLQNENTHHFWWHLFVYDSSKML